MANPPELSVREVRKLMISGEFQLSPDELESFRSRAEPIGDCLFWTGSKQPKGYGLVDAGRFRTQAHVLAFYLAYGSLQHGKCVCHTCDHPPCVRPEHLWEGSAGDNNRDCVAKARNRHRSFGTGGDNPNTKLTPDQVREVRALRAQGVEYKELIKRFGVQAPALVAIIKGRTWRQVS